MNSCKLSSGLAAVASYLCVGLGQVFNGQIWKGIGFMLINCVLLIVTTLFIVLATWHIGYTFWVAVMLIVLFAFWVFNIFDAKRTAERSGCCGKQ